MKNFAENLRQEIEKKKIEPLPSYFFWIKNIGIALFFVLSLLLGGVILSLILYSIFEGGFEGIRPFYFELLRSLPLLWIVSFILFSSFALWGIHHFPKGYKISFIFFVIVNLVCTLLLAAVLYFFDFPEYFQKYERNIPFHTSVQEQVENDWNRPEKGFLSGVVVNAEGGSIVLQTIAGETWKVSFSERFRLPRNAPKQEFIKGSNPEEKLEKTNNTDQFSRKQQIFINRFKGRRIKVIGKIENKETFIFSAEKIMPWRNNRFKPCRDLECEDFEREMNERRGD